MIRALFVASVGVLLIAALVVVPVVAVAPPARAANPALEAELVKIDAKWRKEMAEDRRRLCLPGKATPPDRDSKKGDYDGHEELREWYRQDAEACYKRHGETVPLFVRY